MIFDFWSSQLRRSSRAKIEQAPAGDFGFVITGGLGDYIVVARFIRDFLSKASGASFDVYSQNPELVTWVLSGVPGFRYAFHESIYDQSKRSYRYCLRLNQMAYVERRPMSLLDSYAHWKFDSQYQGYCENISRNLSKIAPIANAHPRLDGALGQYAVFKNKKRHDFLHYLSEIKYGGDALNIGTDDLARERFNLASEQYVTLHTGFDEAMGKNGKVATKVYLGWPEVIRHLRKLGFTLKIVQIGRSNTSVKVDGMDIDLVDNTSLKEAASIISGAAMHLDNEGGLVHLARSFGVACCVIFGPTSIDYFSYSDNLNLASGVCGGCWWADPDWMMNCPRGFAQPVCMTSHSPQKIANAIVEKLARDRDLRKVKRGSGTPEFVKLI